MSQIPNLGIQLVHIQGPLKGEIQTFTSGRVLIGRHPDCDLQFPKDLVIMSRRHAEIVREGNRFKLIDRSTNGTFVNGKPVTETYLKDGDVITFAEGGPKVSFLTQVIEGQAAGPNVQAEPEPVQTPPGPAPVQPEVRPSPPASGKPPADGTPEPEPVNVPFAIQYGPALKSFRSLPIVIGRGQDCDFVIDHPALEQRQVQVFFARDGYWIKDLTGQAMVRVNHQPLQGAVVLEADAVIRLAPEGPQFRFLGGGRLVELEAASQAQSGPQPPPEPPAAKPSPTSSGPSGQTEGKASSLFKKFFS